MGVYAIREFVDKDNNIYRIKQTDDYLGLRLDDDNRKMIEANTNLKVKNMKWYPASRIQVYFHDSDLVLICYQVANGEVIDQQKPAF